MKIDPKIYKNDKFYGNTVVGTKGQVVIPAEARRDLNIKSGDTLLVMGKMNKALGLVKAEQLSELIKALMDVIDDEKTKKQLTRHIKQFEKLIK